MKLKLALVIGVCGVVAMAAQESCSAQTGSVRAMLAVPSVADAMADAYGQAVIDNFAKIISDQGDANCRDVRKLNKAALKRGAEAILVSYGNRLVTLQSGRASEERLAEKLDELAGAGLPPSEVLPINAVSRTCRPSTAQSLMTILSIELLVPSITTRPSIACFAET